MGSCWDDYFEQKADERITPLNQTKLPKKETIELNGEKYLKEDLEEALKHLKPAG